MTKNKPGLRERLFRVGISLVVVIIMSAAMLRKQPTEDKNDD